MDELHPSYALKKGILSQIGTEERRRAKRYLLLSATSTMASIAGIVFSAQYVLRSIYQSSFYKYVSLLFTDSDIVLSYWRQFILSLIESLPFFALTLVLVAIVVLLVSIRVFITNARLSLSFSLSN